MEALTLCHQDSTGKELSERVGVALVGFPGAHGGLDHRTKGVTTIGDKVRAVFVAKSRRVGSILDIECFRSAFTSSTVPS